MFKRILILSILMLAAISCSDQNNRASFAQMETPVIKWDTTSNGLIYTVVRQGTGPVAKSGDQALIHETTQ